MKKFIISILLLGITCQIYADTLAIRVSLFPNNDEYVMVELFSFDDSSLKSMDQLMNDKNIQQLLKYQCRGMEKTEDKTVNYSSHLFLVKEGKFEQKRLIQMVCKRNASKMNNEILFKGTIKHAGSNQIQINFTYEDKFSTPDQTTSDTGDRLNPSTEIKITNTIQVKLDEVVFIGGARKIKTLNEGLK